MTDSVLFCYYQGNISYHIRRFLKSVFVPKQRKMRRRKGRKTHKFDGNFDGRFGTLDCTLKLHFRQQKSRGGLPRLS